MKKISYICNQCGNEIQDTGTRIFFSFFDTIDRSQIEDVTIPEDDVHFCTECTRKITEKLLKPLATGEIKLSDIKVGGEGKPKKRVRLDTGKVMALHNAGWDNAKIADEMKVTERQIYQCIRYQRNKNNPESEPDGKEQEDEEQ